MGEFLQLPRELRDLVYMEVLLWERARPSLRDVRLFWRFRRMLEPSSSLRGEYGCAYALDAPPATCSNLMCCSRQIYDEMREPLERLRRKGQLRLRLDCLAEDESFHYFMWRAVPLVQTTRKEGESKSSGIPDWASEMMGRYFHRPQGVLAGGGLGSCSTSTRIHQLWIDVRLVGDRSAKWLRNSSPSDRTSWAVCAALKRLLENGPRFPDGNGESSSSITIDEVVLNVVTPSHVPADQFLDEHARGDAMGEGMVHPRSVARELVDVWNRIWRGEDYKGAFYQMLLQRVARVKVCVDGEVWRTRELKLELERGQAASRRINERRGW